MEQRDQAFDRTMLKAMLKYAEDVVFAVRECDPADAIVRATAPNIWGAGLELTDCDDPAEVAVGYVLALHALLRAPEALQAVTAGLCEAIAEYLHEPDMTGDLAIIAQLNASLPSVAPAAS